MLNTMNLSIGSLEKKEQSIFDMQLARYMPYQRNWHSTSTTIGMYFLLMWLKLSEKNKMNVNGYRLDQVRKESIKLG